MSKNRPLGVSIIAILQIFAALIVMAAGALLIIGMGEILGNPESASEELFAFAFAPAVVIAGIIVVFIGFLFFLLGKGLWDLNKASWFIEEILYGLSALPLLISFDELANGSQQALTTSIVALIIFIYLFLVRDAFNQHHHYNQPQYYK